MSAPREDDRQWLENGAERDPDGWEAGYIEEFGIEGALDVLALQGGRVHEVNLTHRPFAANEPFKQLVYDAREALSAVGREAYVIAFARLDERRERIARANERDE